MDMATRAVLFDLDGTLLDRHSSLIVCVHRQRERCADLLGAIPMVDYFDEVVEFRAAKAVGMKAV
jgi:beta-phosphoglucomutase-like phosphatase (HAD superfamily)